MKVEIVQADNIAELDKLINACIQKREVSDIKLTTTQMEDGEILYTALILLEVG